MAAGGKKTEHGHVKWNFMGLKTGSDQQEKNSSQGSGSGGGLFSVCLGHAAIQRRPHRSRSQDYRVG